jgi:hypothetical protein
MKWNRVFNYRALVWAAWGLVLLAGLAGLFTWHSVRSYEIAIKSFERYVGPSHHRDYSQAPIPDVENAAIAFRTAVSELEVDRWAGLPEPAAWSPANDAEARDALALYADELDALESAAELSGCVWPAATRMDLDAARAALSASRLLRLAAFVGVVDAEGEQLKLSFDTLGRLAECLYAQPHLAGSMIAAAVERSRLEVVHAALSDPRTGDELLQVLDVELERDSHVDRVQWAIAAEGALALRLLEERQPGSDSARARLLRAAFSKRIATAAASRWVELKGWSERPLEELLTEMEAQPRSGPAVAGLVADLLVPNLRSAIISLHTNQALIDLARAAIEAREYGQHHGSYADAFDGQSGIDILSGGDGSIVLIDSELESALRTHSIAMGASDTHGMESTLDLTVWRLPPPRQNPQ